MPTYRITLRTDDVDMAFEVFAYDAVAFVRYDDPADLQRYADQHRRGTTVVGVRNSLDVKYEMLEPVKKKPRPPISPDEELILESVRTRSASGIAFTARAANARAKLSKKGLVTWSAIEGWGLTKAGMLLALELTAERLRR